MRTDERGQVSMEMVLLVPLIVLLIGVATVGGRMWLARAAVADAAQSAARAASISRSAAEAGTAADRTARGNLDGQIRCTSVRVSTDLSGFAVPVGRAATTAVDVSCTVALSDVSFPGLPGQLTLSARGTSVLDTYRGRN